LVAATACSGFILAFDTPSRTALIGEMVPVKQLVPAQQMFFVSSQFANIFARALGGMLLGIGGHGVSNESGHSC